MLGHFSKIRTRLTLWYVGIFGAILLSFVCGASVLHYLHLQDQLYHAEIQDMETVEGLLYFAPDGRLLMRDDYFISQEHRMLLDRLIEVLTPDGRILFRNSRLGAKSLGGGPSPEESQIEFFRHKLWLPDGVPVLVLSHARPLQGRTVLIRIGYSLEPIRRQSLQLLGLLLLLVPPALLAAGFMGAKLAGKALDPLEGMAQLTERITAHKLDQRVPVKNREDELGHMALVLNDLLERLEASFQQLRRFTSDVSHELRTPLASIRSVGEVGIQGDYTPERYKDIIGSMLEEVARLTTMIDTLLTIAHADSGVLALHHTKFAARDLVNECVGLVRVLAEDKQQHLSVRLENTGELLADRGFLRMAVVNLLENAVKYSPEAGEILITLRPFSAGAFTAGAEILVEDQGPGIPEAARDRVFDRFYRLDEGRNREAGGVGLGLAIAKWAVEAHGGTISAEGAQGGGAQFVVHLPLAADAQRPDAA